MGYDSTLIIRNLGFLFILGFFSLFFLVIAVVADCLASKYEAKISVKTKERITALKDFFIWGMVLRMLLESYLELAVGSFINMQSI